MPWLVVQVRPQWSRAAIDNVTRQGCEVYSPRCRELVRGALRMRPMFPGYLFARHPGRRWVFLRGTYGVIGVVMGTGGAPAELADAEVARLRAREAEDGAIPLAPAISPGSRVRVGRGLISLDAVVDGMSGRDRVYVLMEVLGAARRVEVSLSDVEPLA